ncbi:MAG: type II toxin-antitoxin system VapC family toxin [bacterium]
MKRFVLDCSVTMAWCFEDEADKYSEAVLDQLAEGECVVPCLWSLEVANVLVVGERNKRLTKAQSSRFVELLSDLPIHVDKNTSERALTGILPIAREHSLSSYDAAYLELSMREGLPMATQDQRLKKAAIKCGVRVL